MAQTAVFARARLCAAFLCLFEPGGVAGLRPQSSKCRQHLDRAVHVRAVVQRGALRHAGEGAAGAGGGSTVPACTSGADWYSTQAPSQQIVSRALLAACCGMGQPLPL